MGAAMTALGLPLFYLLAAFILVTATTPLVARLAVRAGAVDAGRADRWGGRPTPLFGGIAITLGLVMVLATELWGGRAIDPRMPVVAAAVLAAFALGLFDDLRGLRPTSKLVGQVVIGSALAFGGVRVEIIEIPVVAFLLTLLWVAVLMNAVNLVDNMDGLAAGLAAISAGVLVVMAPPEPEWIRLLGAGIVGSCVGFLVHNFPPARIYMGDAGSLALGAALAALTLLQTSAAASGAGLAVLGPLLVLGLPIFDTALVTISRRLEGRPVSQGGRDHTSHRLAASGLTDRETVLTLYGIAAVLALIGLLLVMAGLVLLPLVAIVVLGLVLFGAFLVEMPKQRRNGTVDSHDRVIGSARVLVRYGAEIGVDVALATIALFSAFAIRFEYLEVREWLPIFLRAAPVLVSAQLIAFVLLGVYRTLWAFMGVADLVFVLRGAFVGTAGGALVLLVLLADVGQSRAVFLIDGVLFVLLVTSARFFVLWLRHWIALRPRAGDRRVLIVGASDRGELALRLLLRDRSVAFHPAGFLDDDPGKQRRRIGGVSVLGRIAELPEVARRQKADLVIVAVENSVDVERVRAGCRMLNLEMREFTSGI